MRVLALGESACLITDLGEIEPWVVAESLHRVRFPGFVDSAAAYESVGVYFEPGSIDAAGLHELLESISSQMPPFEASRLHEVPVCYEMGEDWDAVSASLGLRVEEVIAAHSAMTYTCYAIGFQPGFPYLGYLPPQLCGIRRLPQPRLAVPAGSVAVTGGQTGIYPAESPGGWALIGRTPLKIASMDEEYFPIRAGDRVRFLPIGREEFADRLGERL
jgi:inhibitor of KinA